MPRMVCAVPMSRLSTSNPVAKRQFLPILSMLIEAETVPDHRIQQTSIGLSVLPTQNGPPHMTCDRPLLFVAGSTRLCRRPACSLLALYYVRW
jgi:hypothetical protein